ncbi:MAG: DUF3990 domain-containing protein [Dysgonamonadaceae bacterium]|jgi:hypothetical protein|nr:DUF3990 domain-containing protein [Dysgonamonadaceae bacterium]
MQKTETIDLSKCRIGTDFGRGFYVTGFLKQAEDIAARVASWHDATPVVTTFEFNEYAFEDKEFIEELRFKKPMHQICFCTTASLQMLSSVANKNASKILQIEDLLVEQLMFDSQIDETQATDMFYNSETFAQLTDYSAELYLRPWQEIYERLKKELKM